MSQTILVRDTDLTPKQQFLAVGDIAGVGGALRVVRFPFAFDTPGLATTGIAVYTPTAGETVIWSLSYLSVPVAFDFTGLSGAVYLSYTWSDYAGAFNSSDLTVVDATDDTGHTVKPAYRNFAGETGIAGEAGISYFPDTTPFTIILTDESGADPGSTVGTGELVLVVVDL